uniref:site-specific DNA-methyltransferase (adenine-specific) n=1 Tax=candidate division WOR-3 bacterium TaxID=2052148 RepID=A0A7C3UWU6_UNCW3
MGIKEIVEEYKSAEKDKIFPFSEWHRKDVFERLVRNFLITIGYNPDQINYNDKEGTIELGIREDLKAIVYVSSIQEEQRFLTSKTIAPSITNKPNYEIAVVTNFEKWFFYFDGKEIYAVSGERLEEEFDTVKSLISRDAIESGKFKEVARKLLYKEDNEPLRQALNTLRLKIANKILQEKTNVSFLKNPDGSYNTEILNEITTRWITRFLSLKLAEDSGITFNFTLKDIRRSFELFGKIAKPIQGAKVKEDTLSNAIRTLMNEFERRFNGGIFMYEEGVDYITVPDSAFFDLLDFTTGWAFTIEDARIIGFVYERFLGQEIVVEERKGKPEAVLKDIGEARGRRKAGGIYYTPKYIVDYIVENTLGEILKEKKNKIDNAVKNLDIDKFTETLKEAKSLRVLDPACGSGSFLIKILAEFKNFYDGAKENAEELKKKIDALKRERTKGQMLFTDDKEVNELLKKYNENEIEKEIEELKFSGVFALRNNIYGVDIDPKAIDITAFTLMVQVYDELKDGARCPTMINENLKIGNSLVSAISPDKRNGFISRGELERFKDDISNLIALREIEKRIDLLDEDELKKLIEKNFEDILDVYISIKEKYPNAIPTPQQKLLDEWHKKAKKEPIEKTFDILIHQTGLARIFLKEVYFERIKRIKEKIEFEINKPLIKYFNSEKKLLKDREFEEILKDEERIKEELKFIKDRATEISKSQPPKVFNWELEFPEVFFNEDGTLKENPGFDCVVGNPPWGRIKQFPEKVEKALLGEYWGNVYTLQVGNLNLYKLFLEQSYLLLRKSGFFSMIFPTSFLGENDSRLLRQEIFQSAKITKILEFPESTEVFGRENTQDVTVLCYKKESIENDYIFEIATNIGKESLPNLNEITLLSLKKSEIEEFSDTYQIPIFQNPQQEWKIVKKISQIPPFKGDEKNPQVGEVGEGHLHETFDKEFLTEKPTGDLVIKGIHLDRYYVNLDPNGPQPRWVKKKEFLRKKPVASQIINSYTAIGRNTQNRAIRPRLRFVTLPSGFILTNAIKYFIPSDTNLNTKYVIGLLNSTILNWRFELFSTQNNIRNYEIESLPIVRATPDQQAPIISLVDAIIQRKKEYHSISQNIEDYIDFKEAKLSRFDEFLKKTTEGFEILSSLEVKNDNFDALRVRIEGDEIILEYGIKRKIEEYEEIDEEEAEVKGKYVID